MAVFNNHLIYDWSYGIISNFNKMGLLNHSYMQRQIPTVAIIFNQVSSHIILTELYNRDVVSIGFVPISEMSEKVDYPITMQACLDNAFVFISIIFKYLIKKFRFIKNVRLRNRSKARLLNDQHSKPTKFKILV